MRTLCGLALGWCALYGLPSVAAELHFPSDARLHAVQFLGPDFGWAVGEDGVIWHTNDGGRAWLLQPSGTRAALRALHFLDRQTGWVVGRLELPYDGGSLGVILHTRDGGKNWKALASNTLPGLNAVRFADTHMGYVAGDGNEQFPGGVFCTTDGGQTWKPLRGPRIGSWLGLHLTVQGPCTLIGTQGQLATLHGDAIIPVETATQNIKSLAAVTGNGDRAVAVGQGAQVLQTVGPHGRQWSRADLPIPTELQKCWDLRAVAAIGQHLWVVGRPGSVLLHSADGGKSWEVRPTGQRLPLNGLSFVDEDRGWAVGDLGTILNTQDGGRTWQVQRRGGERAALLFLHARPARLPLDTLARLGGEEGYLIAAVGGTLQGNSDPFSLAAAVRLSAGAAAEVLWHFPLPLLLAEADEAGLIEWWDRQHADRATEELQRQLVLAIRLWQPDVIVADDAAGSQSAVDRLFAKAAQQAFQMAADLSAFPEQIQGLKLSSWQAAKLYNMAAAGFVASIVHDNSRFSRILQESPRDYAMPAVGLLNKHMTSQPWERRFRLMDSRLAGADQHRDLLQGIPLLPAGVNRRPPRPLVEPDKDLEQALRTRRSLQTLGETPATPLNDPDRLLAQISPMLSRLPEDRAARAAFAVASYQANQGRWELAKELCLLLAERYPQHPVTADACRWAIRYSSSSEARRRHELSQFVLATRYEFSTAEGWRITPRQLGLRSGIELSRKQDAALTSERRLGLHTSIQEARQWYQTSLDLGKRLTGLGPAYANDPAIQFCLQAARRQLGDIDTARMWYAEFRTSHPEGPWSAAAAGELWLLNRSGLPPRSAAPCPRLTQRPYLDGNLNDACWQCLKPLMLRDAVGETATDNATEVWLAYDGDFLYLALNCRRSGGRQAEPVKVRSRDADLRSFDRVGLLLDLDRDYATTYHLQIDERGCAWEACWGDVGWDPRWFVAVKSDASGWRAEAAIPLLELTGENVSAGRAWAVNVVRVLPLRGVQAWSLPADVEPRPEGLGLLIFAPEAARPGSHEQGKP